MRWLFLPTAAVLFSCFGSELRYPEVKHKFLAVDSDRSRLLLVNEFHPDQDWTIDVPQDPRDLRLIGRDKVLMSHLKGAAEYEIKTGRQTWMIDTFNGIQSAIRLKNGNTFLAGNSPEGITFHEADPEGKEISRRVLKGMKDVHLVQLLENGNILLTRNEHTKRGGPSWVLEVDKEDKTVWEVEVTPHVAYDAERLRNGHTLISGGETCVIAELDKDGKVVATRAGLETHPNLGLKWIASIEAMRNGNVIAANRLGHGASPAGPHLVEFDRNNRLVWSWTDPERAQTVHNSLTLE